MAYVRVTDAAIEPLSFSEARDHLRINCTDDAVYVNSLIEAARRYVEHETSRSLITTTWRLSLDCFPTCSWIEIHKAPLIAVSSVTYVDTAGTVQTWDSANYEVDNDSEPCRLSLAYSKVWPSIREQVNAVKVTFTAGYGSSGSNVPEGLKHAMKLMIGHWYETREAVTTEGTPHTVPMSVDSLLAGYRWKVYG